jgi:hypothetical protein
MQAAYLALHRAGYAHSFETWQDGELVAARPVRVAIGRMFYGESMFSRATDASKVALVALVEELPRARLPSDRLPAAHPAAGPRWAHGDPAAAVFAPRHSIGKTTRNKPGIWTLTTHVSA